MENKTLDIVKKVKSDLSSYRQQFEKNRKEEEDAYYGDIWKNTSRHRPFENEIFQIIEGELPILTDSLPSVAPMSHDPSKVNQVKTLSKAIDWVFKDQDLEIDYPTVIRNALICGDGWIHQYYDANADNGQGKICNELVHWSNVFLEGRSSKIDTCEKARIELKRSKNWLKLAYQKSKEEIDGLKGEKSQDGYREGRETYDVGNIGPKKRIKPQAYCDEDTLCLVKTFVKDYTVEPIPREASDEDLMVESEVLANGEMPDVNKFEDHKYHIESHVVALIGLYDELGLTPDQGFEVASEVVDQILMDSPESGVDQTLKQIKFLEMHIEQHQALLDENPESGRLKFRNGWREIHSINNLVVYDGEMLDDHGMIPLVPFYCYKNDPIFGYSEVRNILDSQRMNAIMTYKEYKGLQKVANPAMVLDKETGLTSNDITNEDGAIYEIPQGTNIRHLSPGAASPQLGSFRLERTRRIQSISGVNEVTQGQVTQPNASGVSVQKTQNQAIGRIRLKDRQNQYYSLRRLGKMTASNIVQYWHSEKFLGLHQDETIYYNPLDMQDLEYSIEIAPGSMAGVDKESFNSLAVQFLQAGHINFEQFLDIAHIPRSEKIKEMISDERETVSQMQQLQEENILLKGQLNPELLTEEEAQVFEELSQQQGLTNEQPL